MTKYSLKYWYMATGEGFPQEYPEQVIEAESRDEALFKYHKSNGMGFTTLEEFIKEPEYVKDWATTVKIIEK